MLIDPRGLLYGERIGACSDDAQLHFPRLMAGSNGFGRIEMSYTNLVKTVYAHFSVKPTKEQLQAWFREYHHHFLIFVYRTAEGATWGQWDVPRKMLPRYKTAEDNRSPAPPDAEYAAYQEQHVTSKRAKYLTSEDSLSISEDFGNVPKASEEFGAFVHGIGTGIGEEQEQASPSAHDDNSQPAMALKSKAEDEALKDVFGYYLERTGRKASAYTLTPTRKQKGLARLRECRIRSGGDLAPAAAMMKTAVDGICGSDWHMGRDAKSKDKRYVEWENHLFGSVESLERWMEQANSRDTVPQPKTRFVDPMAIYSGSEYATEAA